MKKLLLSMALCALTFAANAQEVVSFADGLPANWTNNETGTLAKQNRDIDGATVKCLQLQKNASITSPAINGLTEFTLALNISSKAKTLKVEQTLDNGTTWTELKTIDKAECDTKAFKDFKIQTGVTSGDVKVRLTCGDANSYYISTFTYTAIKDTSKDPAGLSFGDTKSFRVVKGEDFTAPALINPNNLPVTWTSSDEAVATVDAEGALSILAPGKTTIKAASEATDKYFAGSASYELTVVGKAATIADLVANFSEQGDEAYVACPAVVTYVNGRNCYVKAVDGNAAALIYQETEYELGDVIPAGWYATASPYSGLLEYTAEGLQPSTETKEVVYEKVAAVTGADINRVVVLTGVNFAEDTPERTADKGSKAANFNGTLADGSTLVFRTNFPVESVKAGAYEVTGAVAFYIPKEGDGYLQFYPISYKLDENTGVAGIEAEAEAVYFDLQGNRVAEPETGIYIKVAGGRASKVLF